MMGLKNRKNHKKDPEAGDAETEAKRQEEDKKKSMYLHDGTYIKFMTNLDYYRVLR